MIFQNVCVEVVSIFQQVIYTILDHKIEFLYQCVTFVFHSWFVQRCWHHEELVNCDQLKAEKNATVLGGRERVVPCGEGQEQGIIGRYVHACHIEYRGRNRDVPDFLRKKY